MRALAALRRDRGLTQRGLAQALGVHTSTVAQYERGRRTPTWKHVRQIAAFFHVPPGQIVFSSAIPSPVEVSDERLKDLLSAEIQSAFQVDFESGIRQLWTTGAAPEEVVMVARRVAEAMGGAVSAAEQAYLASIGIYLGQENAQTHLARILEDVRQVLLDGMTVEQAAAVCPRYKALLGTPEDVVALARDVMDRAKAGASQRNR